MATKKAEDLASGSTVGRRGSKRLERLEPLVTKKGGKVARREVYPTTEGDFGEFSLVPSDGLARLMTGPETPPTEGPGPFGAMRAFYGGAFQRLMGRGPLPMEAGRPKQRRAK